MKNVNVNMKKCPTNIPNIICFKNVSVGLIFFVVLFSFLYLISKIQFQDSSLHHSIQSQELERIQRKEREREREMDRDRNNRDRERDRDRDREIVIERSEPPRMQIRPNYGYTNLPGDVLMNPYMPPVRDERYLVAPPIYPPNVMPINVPTNPGAVDTPYRQVGILTPAHGSSRDNILPLIGRPVMVSRDKWQYYTMSNQNNSIKLPLVVKGRSATDEYGVDKLYDKDHVLVLGQNERYVVTVYDNDTIRYIPYI